MSEAERRIGFRRIMRKENIGAQRIAPSESVNDGKAKLISENRKVKDTSHPALADFVDQLCDECIHGLHSHVTLFGMADGHTLGGGFLLADDQHVGRAVELRVSDFRTDLIGGIVQ